MATAPHLREPATPGRRHRRPGRGRLRVLALMGWTLVALAGVFLWPQRFGGDTALVVVHGRSMEPTYHSGDLLLVRSTDDLDVGEIAVYRLTEGIAAGQNIVHRAVAKDRAGRFTFRGDAKPDADDARPRIDDIVGRPLVNLGPLPLRLVAITPLLAGVVAAFAVGWYLWPAPSPRRPADSSG